MAEKREVVKKGKNFVLYSDGCIRIDNVRLSYPHLDKPWAGKAKDGSESKPKFSMKALMDKTTHDAVKQACVEMINTLCTERKLGKLGADQKFIRNGDDLSGEECEGMWVVSASENVDRPPSLRLKNGRKIKQEEANEVFYAGCYVNALIRPWAQNNDWGKKINANLIAVQFWEDGERIGEAPIDDDGVFEETDDDPMADDGEL